MHQGKTDPPGVAIELRFKARQTTYTLDLGKRSPQEFERFLEEIKQENARSRTPLEFPPTPRLDLVLEIYNTGTKLLQILLGGSNHTIWIDAEGPGVVTIQPGEPIPAMIFPAEQITLGPGLHHEIAVHHLPIPALPALTPGRCFTYWTRPGPYTLTAKWEAGIAPAPPGTRALHDEFGLVTVVSNPLTLQVVV